MGTLNKIFGHKVRFYRKLQNVSQEKLASLSGLHRTYIGSIERGERNVSLQNVEKIAVALSVEVSALLEEGGGHSVDAS